MKQLKTADITASQALLPVFPSAFKWRQMQANDVKRSQVCRAALHDYRPSRTITDFLKQSQTIADYRRATMLAAYVIFCLLLPVFVDFCLRRMHRNYGKICLTQATAETTARTFCLMPNNIRVLRHQ
jgi:hypothetical protein